MIVLGISGCEDRGRSSFTPPYAARTERAEALLSFGQGRIPIQYFPLQLLGHDAAAAILRDGQLVAFVAEERLSRVKHGFNLAGRSVLPRLAIRHCLQAAGVRGEDVDLWAHYCRFDEAVVARRLARLGGSLGERERALLGREHAEAYANRLSAKVIREQLSAIANRDLAPERLARVPHHAAHAAGAFHSSGFREAALLTVDGYGEEESLRWGVGGPDGVALEGSLPLPSSLGLLYQVVTIYLGFRSFGDEYKVMGLSSYGRADRYRPFFARLVEPGPGGALAVRGLTRPDLWPWLREELGPIDPPGGFSARAADIAAALQQALEGALLHVARGLRDRYRLRDLCLSGGVALNACANGALLRSGLFTRVFIQPAAGDDGASLGAALHACREHDAGARPGPVEHVHWGPGFDDAAIERALRQAGARWRRVQRIEHECAALLARGMIVGWFQGRAEMGPRALGARSILADPRSAELRDRLNARVKGREQFRPFAPVVTQEDAAACFDMPPRLESPFMLVTFATRDAWRARIPGVVHVDGSARVQTITRDANPRYHELVRRFGELTGVPVVLNTSFNRAGEPIVTSPDEALACFRAGGLDALAMEDYLVWPDAAEGA